MAGTLRGAVFNGLQTDPPTTKILRETADSSQEPPEESRQTIMQVVSVDRLLIMHGTRILRIRFVLVSRVLLPDCDWVRSMHYFRVESRRFARVNQASDSTKQKGFVMVFCIDFVSSFIHDSSDH